MALILTILSPQLFRLKANPATWAVCSPVGQNATGSLSCLYYTLKHATYSWRPPCRMRYILAASPETFSSMISTKLTMLVKWSCVCPGIGWFMSVKQEAVGPMSLCLFIQQGGAYPMSRTNVQLQCDQHLLLGHICQRAFLSIRLRLVIRLRMAFAIVGHIPKLLHFH